MRKILIVNTSGLGMGGITTHMLNYIQALKQKGYEGIFTIVVTGVRDERVLKNFVDLGCILENFPDRKKQFLRYFLSLKLLMQCQKFDVIHVHGNSSTMGLELCLAKIEKVPVRIAHCHNSKCDHPMVHKLLYPLLKVSYTQAVACSTLAGDWIFGGGNYEVLPNAIDLKKYQYNPETRRRYREMLNVNEETLLVGHVGNFNEQKNHEFLVDVFCEISKQKKAKLILIGTGPLQETVKEQVKCLQMENDVYFLGVRNDVNCWMQAMDVFVFPSRWEGFGMVLIEGQASNLPMVVSNEVPRIVKVTDNIHFVDLNEGASTWGNYVLNSTINVDRESKIDLKIRQYDLSENICKLAKLYD